MGLGESSWEGNSIGLAYCGTKANMGPKNIPAGAQFIGRGYQNEVLMMMFTVSSQLHAPSTGGLIRCYLRH